MIEKYKIDSNLLDIVWMNYMFHHKRIYFHTSNHSNKLLLVKDIDIDYFNKLNND